MQDTTKMDNIHIIEVTEREKSARRKNAIFQELMAEFFKLTEDIKLQIQEALTITPNDREAKILREIIVKQLKTKDKVKILEVPRGKKSIKRATIRLKANFSVETLGAKR